MARTARAATLTGGSRITGGPREALKSDYAKRYLAGESVRAIAAQSGRSYGFVYNLLSESKTALRARGGATRAATPAASGKQSSAKSSARKASPRSAPATKTTTTKKTAAKSATTAAAKKAPAKKAGARRTPAKR